MGCLFATALQRSGTPCTLLLRKRQVEAAQPVLVEHKGALHSYAMDFQAAAHPDPISHLLVTTKAYDIREAFATVRPRLREDTQILLLANGMGYVEELRADRLEQPLYCGTTTEGAYRVAQRHIRHAGSGETRIGLPEASKNKKANEAPKHNPHPNWFKHWSSAVSNCHWDEGIDEALWLKLVINCAINPLTAINRCPNGALADNSVLAKQVQNLCDEMVPICRALGFETAAGGLHLKVREVISATATNRSSMLQDIEAGRRTEIDYISGHLVRVAESLGLATSLNEELLTRVREITYASDS